MYQRSSMAHRPVLSALFAGVAALILFAIVIAAIGEHSVPFNAQHVTCADVIDQLPTVWPAWRSSGFPNDVICAFWFSAVAIPLIGLRVFARSFRVKFFLFALALCSTVFFRGFEVLFGIIFAPFVPSFLFFGFGDGEDWSDGFVHFGSYGSWILCWIAITIGPVFHWLTATPDLSHCPYCAYHLHATRGTTCSECGSTILPPSRRTLGNERRRPIASLDEIVAVTLGVIVLATLTVAALIGFGVLH